MQLISLLGRIVHVVCPLVHRGVVNSFKSRVRRRLELRLSRRDHHWSVDRTILITTSHTTRFECHPLLRCDHSGSWTGTREHVKLFLRHWLFLLGRLCREWWVAIRDLGGSTAHTRWTNYSVQQILFAFGCRYRRYGRYFSWLTSLLKAVLGLLTNDAQWVLYDASCATLPAARTFDSVFNLRHDQ